MPKQTTEEIKLMILQQGNGVSMKQIIERIEKLVSDTRLSTIEEVLAVKPEEMQTSKEESDSEWFYAYGHNQGLNKWEENIKNIK